MLRSAGFGPILAGLAAIGAGFLVNDRILAPLLILFLFLGNIGLFLSFQRHHRWPSLILNLASSAIILTYMFVAFNQAMIWVGLTGLFAATLLDVFLKRQSPTPNQ